MKIIIVGGGKSGANLATALTGEGHNVTMIDQNAQRIVQICDDDDVMGLVGNGMNPSSLQEAGLEEADLLIAATGSDEQNLLCCLFAKKVGNCSTIARVRNPMYFNERDFIREQIGLSRIINPEYEAAATISRLLRFPSAIDIASFAKGRAELLTFRIAKGSFLDGKSLPAVKSKVHAPFLFCSIKREEEYIIPSGNFVLQAGDCATIITTSREALKFFRQIKMETHAVKDVVIVGGGTISYYLARQLLDTHISVKIIEIDEERCHELSERLPEAMIIQGDASDKSLLLEEGITSTDAFVALTGFDEENVLLSLYAREMSNAKVITKVDRPIFTELVANLDLDSVVIPHTLTTDIILSYARAKQNALGNNIETLYKLVEDRVEALEFKINENAPGLNIPLKELKLIDNLIVCGIIRGRRFIIPNGETTIQPEDRVIIVTSTTKLNDFKDILK